MDTKICTECGIEKPLDAFHRRYERPCGYRSKCAACVNKHRKRHYEADKKSGKLKEQIWARSNINISYEEYIEKYNDVDGCCEICGTQFDVLCVDHNHDNGEIRGLLCTKCNLGLENLKESEEVLVNAIKYLAKYGANPCLK
jgi:hypothetical protein